MAGLRRMMAENGCRSMGALARVLRLHLEEAAVYAFEFRPVAHSGPA